VTTVAEAVKS